MNTTKRSAAGRKASESRGAIAWGAVNRELAQRNEAAILQTKFDIRMEEALLERMANLSEYEVNYLRDDKERMLSYATKVADDLTGNRDLMDAWSLEWNIERFLVGRAVREGIRRMVPEVMDLLDCVEAKRALGF